jgi:inhibitor of KinA sporulation pathway (predicted exonuclease)
MKITTLDLELNQPSGKICQIGAVVGDTITGEISQRLKIYVNPGEPIAPFITELCGITQNQIDTQGVPLAEAYLLLKDFHRRYSEFMNPVTWGGGDSETVRVQLGFGDTDDWCFGRRWIDAKTLVVSQMIAKENAVYSGGLSSAMKRFGLKFQGRKHDALDDAENTFRIYHQMLYLMRHGSF